MHEPNPAGEHARRQRRAWAGLAGAIVIGLVAASPLWRVPFFESDDGLTHLWRVWEYARAAGDVGPFVRWAPDAAYGFGAPVFTFYNPLSYQLGALVMGLGATAAAATKLLLAASLVGAAVGAYLLGRAWAVRAPTVAGIAAALLYTLVPYRLATVYQRGALAEALGLAVAPFVVLLALRAASQARPGRAVAGLAVATGALLLFHTIAALLTLPAAGLLGLGRVVELPREERLRALLRLVAGLGLGLAIGAIYWLPAFAQQSTVQLERARWSEGGMFDARLTWPWELVQATVLHDYGRDAGEAARAAGGFPRLAGLAALALLAGLGTGLASGRLRRPTGLAVLALLAAALALASPPAAPLWERVTLLAAVQLGWRFLGLVLLAAIPLAACLVDFAAAWRRLPGLALAAAAALSALWQLPVEPLAWSAGQERPAELAAFERKHGQFALGALREYVPRWATVPPEALPYDPNPETRRSDAAIEARLERYSGGQRVYRVESVTPAAVTFDLSYHPALAASVDGQPAALRPGDEMGLAVLDVPDGTHEVAIGPAATAIERAAGALSLAALLGAAALALVPQSVPGRAAVAGASAALLLTVGLAGAGGITSSTVVEARNDAGIVIGSGAVGDLEAIEPIPLGDGLAVLAVVADDSLVASYGVVTLDLHLHARRVYADAPQLAVALVASGGGRVAESRGTPGGGFRPATRWRPDELLVARSELRLPAGTPGGSYTVEVGFDGATASVGSLTLPAAGGRDPFGTPLDRHEALFGDGLVLDGYEYDRGAPGGPFRGSFWWRRISDADPADLEATLSFLDKQGNALASQTRSIGGNANLRPTADFRLDLPDPLPGESYRLEMALRAPGGGTLPARTFDGQPTGALLLRWFDVADRCGCVPSEATLARHAFQDGIVLRGWRVERTGEEVRLELWWGADARPTRDYVVFLHAIDADRLVAQVDDMPNGGRRPTSGWRAGQIIPDRYRLRLPSGAAASLKVGLYTPGSGERLPLDPPTQENAITIPVQPR